MGVGMGEKFSVNSLQRERLILKSEVEERFLAPRTPLGMTGLGRGQASLPV